MVTVEQITLFAILGTALALFARSRIRYDVVAVLALLAAVITGLVPAEEAFLGFGHPAVITVAAILVLSRAIGQTGLVDLAARWLQRFSASPTRHVFALGSLTAVLSAFINNVGAVALVLPVALRSALDVARPPSQILMPVSFASLLGGLVTLIGTPPNIIIANLRAAQQGEPFGMFDFTPVGLGVALAGVIFVALIGWRLIPFRAEPSADIDALFHIEDYITEVRLPADTPFVGKRIIDLETLAQGNIAVVALIRRKDRMLAPSGFLRLQADDILILESDTATLDKIVEDAQLELVGTAEMTAENLRSERVGMLEVVVMPGSRMEGRTARTLRLHSRFGLNLLGVAREGQAIGERLGSLRFTAGDVLLLQGEREAMPDAFSALGCLPLAERGIAFGRRPTRLVSPLAFAGAILLVAIGLLPPQIAFVAAVAVIVIAGEVSLRDLYDSIDWSVIVLLGALIPVGMALETTGGSQVIAAPILALKGELPVWALLALLMVVTMLLSDVMNNAATAVLMAPIGITIAQGLGADADPFLMAVAVGASSTYLTPIGHQSNLLVMGPGGYRFGDYWRMGLPLDVIIVAVAVPLILMVWPV
ncbi:MAG: SLC13 family permease [Kiloniellales bacterium]|nr:SLC13 family permease [Kiloniellales bacterium]